MVSRLSASSFISLAVCTARVGSASRDGPSSLLWDLASFLQHLFDPDHGLGVRVWTLRSPWLYWSLGLLSEVRQSPVQSCCLRSSSASGMGISPAGDSWSTAVWLGTHPSLARCSYSPCG